MPLGQGGCAGENGRGGEGGGSEGSSYCDSNFLNALRRC